MKFQILLLAGLGLNYLAAPAIGAEPERPRITGVAHLALYVHDLEKTRAFYKDFLGYGEPFSLTNQDGSVRLTFIKINDRQYLELFPEREPGADRLNHIALETANAERLRVYLAARGVKVPEKVGTGRIGNSNFNITDPDGHTVEIVQYEPESWTTRERGKCLPDERISTSMRHVGILVTNLEAAMKFYRGILGGEETWRGGRTTNELSWVNLRVPNGADYIEFMLTSKLPEPDKRGTAHHLCLEVEDVAQAAARLESRPARKDYPRKLEIQIGKNRKRQLNLYDPDGTRVELMEARPVAE
jgi:catechol 2,3-dioxygenase-like lactoylglutathione lyase family enzyme